ncbi:hypothetical protein ACLMJK_002596 [Lecanora helva]
MASVPPRHPRFTFQINPLTPQPLVEDFPPSTYKALPSPLQIKGPQVHTQQEQRQERDDRDQQQQQQQQRPLVHHTTSSSSSSLAIPTGVDLPKYKAYSPQSFAKRVESQLPVETKGTNLSALPSYPPSPSPPQPPQASPSPPPPPPRTPKSQTQAPRTTTPPLPSDRSSLDNPPRPQTNAAPVPLTHTLRRTPHLQPSSTRSSPPNRPQPNSPSTPPPPSLETPPPLPIPSNPSHAPPSPPRYSTFKNPRPPPPLPPAKKQRSLSAVTTVSAIQEWAARGDSQERLVRVVEEEGLVGVKGEGEGYVPFWKQRWFKWTVGVVVWGVLCAVGGGVLGLVMSKGR